MATTYTTNARLQKPAAVDRNWDVPLNANADTLDSMAAIGGLAVTVAEAPSASLDIRVAAGTFAAADGTIGTFAGATAVTVTASTTTYLWLTSAGVLSSGPSFPTSAHIRLAQVVAGATSITQVIDQRICFAAQGNGLGFVLKAGDTMSGPLSIVNAGTGTPVLSITTSPPAVGFFGTTPNTQASSLAPLTDATTGIAGGVIQNVGASFSQSELNSNFASLAAQINALTAALKRHGLMSS